MKHLYCSEQEHFILTVTSSHLWRSSRRSCWEPWSGKDHGRGWCSSSYAGKPGTSLQTGTSYRKNINHITYTLRQVPAINSVRTADASDGSACKVFSWTVNLKLVKHHRQQACQKKQKTGHTALLTLVTIEVARDVDAFTSHHHHFVAWKQNMSGVKEQT